MGCTSSRSIIASEKSTAKDNDQNIKNGVAVQQQYQPQQMNPGSKVEESNPITPDMIVEYIEVHKQIRELEQADIHRRFNEKCRQLDEIANSPKIAFNSTLVMNVMIIDHLYY